MTAEVAILNKDAVALAADSAVTFAAQRKLFNTASKLFALSHRHPVGIMIYNGASYMGIPWETIIKMYRERLGHTRFETLKDYSDHFLEFLRDHEEGLFARGLQDQYFQTVIGDFFLRIRGACLAYLNTAKPIKDLNKDEVGGLLDLLSEVVEKISIECDNYDLVSGWTLEEIHKVQESHDQNVRQIISDVFPNMGLGEATIDNLKKVAISLFAKKVAASRFLSGWYSGIVIAGFGNREIFPSLMSYEVYGGFNGKFRVDEGEPKAVDQIHDAHVLPFAQRNMVETFLDGVGSPIRSVMEAYLADAVKRVAGFTAKWFAKTFQLQEHVERPIRRELEEYCQPASRIFKEALEDLIKEQHRGPVYRAVASLPKRELADLAESLVNLTSLKQRISMDRETVGGPVDVAVISKGDGFVWIKKKAYFPAEINPRFYERYCPLKKGDDCYVGKAGE